MPERALPFPLPVVPPKFTPLTAAAQNRRLAQDLYRQFFAWPIERSQNILETTPPEVWEREGQRRALQVFHAAAHRVPAYKDFLKKHRVDPEKVRTIADFKKVVPVTDKTSYLRGYDLPKLCWDGIIASTQMTSVSSGSSGKLFFWPRGALLEIETTFLFELMLAASFGIGKRSTLFVNSQSMGMYIGGPFTLNTLLRIAQKGHRLNIVTPGISLEDVIQVIAALRKNYDQMILAAYPPFAKDILDIGRSRGIEWEERPTKFILFGEGFSEDWRDYIAHLGGDRDAIRDFINCYGTADAAILAHETAFSIEVRRAISRDSKHWQERFPDQRFPSLMQYCPTLRFFEVDNGELIFSYGSGGIPLVRYNIHDRGLILHTSDDLLRFWKETIQTYSNGAWRLPLLALFGRSDFTTTLYGLNVYPENIKAALVRPEVRKFLSGKFQMSTEYRRVTRNQYLLIRVELAPGVKTSRRLQRNLGKVVVDVLRHVNAEYRKLHESIGRKAIPVVQIHKWGDKRYFTVGAKQKWTKRRKI